MARLYAAGDEALTMVDDGKVETALEERGARCLAVDPRDPGTVYIGTSDAREMPDAPTRCPTRKRASTLANTHARLLHVVVASSRLSR